MNGLICSGGSSADKINVSASGTQLVKFNRHLKYIRISNLSNSYITIMPQNSVDGTCPCVNEKGIILAPKGTCGWFIEFNNDNMFYCDIWAITDSENADVAVLTGY